MVKMKRCYTDFETLPLVLDVKDVASIMRLSRAGAYNLMNSKDFPKLLQGKRVLVEKAEFINWLKSIKQ